MGKIAKTVLLLLASALAPMLGAVTPIPAAYTPLEYVTIPRCNSSRNSVATGLAWTNVKRIDFSYATTDKSIGNYIAFANYTGTDYASAKVPYINFAGTSSVSLSFPGGSATATYDPSSSYTRDGSFLSVSLTDVSATADGYICFGDAWSDGNWTITADWGEVKFYGADDVLLAHYLPCLRKVDGAVGFYEAVSGEFAIHSVPSWPGFTAGPEKPREPYLRVTGDPVEYGVPVPDYGFDLDVSLGVAKEYAAPKVVTNAAADVEATCQGWVLTRLDESFVSSNATTNVTVTYSSDIANGTLTWLWTSVCKVTVAADGNGTVDMSECWLRNGESVTVTARASAGSYFDRWEGDVAETDAARNPLVLAYDGAAHHIRAVFRDGTPSVGEPSFLATKALLWLDASKAESIATDGTGAVTGWTSRDSTGKVATPRTASGYISPTYDTTTYGQACVDFGTTGSMKDLQFTGTAFKTAFFCVQIEQNVGAWLIGDTGASFMHRGGKGQWRYSTYHNRISEAWQDGEKVTTSLLDTLMPNDDFYVFSVRMESTYTTYYLTQGNVAARCGGRQLSEVILCGDLSDDEISQVNDYLLRKWKTEPNLTVAGIPDTRGTVTPDYGTYDADLFEEGQSYTFVAQKALTNDSQSLATEVTGWTLTRTDFSSASGSENEATFIYDSMLSYATLSWNWSDWARIPHRLGAYMPRGYRCLKYVEQSTDQARIDTGITLSSETTDILFTFGAKDNTFYATNAVPTDAGDEKWFGMNGGPGFFLGRISNNWRISNNGTLYGISAYSQSLGPLTVAITRGCWCFMPPESETDYTSFAYGDCSHPTTSANDPHLWLFHIGGNEGFWRWAPPGTRIYQVEIYEGATCAHKLVAAQRKRDKVVGFVDLATGSFHTNTVGTLVAGPEDTRYRTGLLIMGR